MQKNKRSSSEGRDFYTDLTIDEILEYASKDGEKRNFSCKKGKDPIYKRLALIIGSTIVILFAMMAVGGMTAPEESKEQKAIEDHKEEQKAEMEAAKETQNGGIGIDNVGENVPADEFILRDSGRKYLLEEDLYGFTAEQCILARSEIYARYGCQFENSKIQQHFEECSWYTPVYEIGEFDETVLNSYDITNRDFIILYEERQGYR